MRKIIKRDNRFFDTGTRLYEFSEEFLVICPKCRGMAKVIPLSSSEKISTRLLSPHRLVCQKCVYRNIWSGRKITFGDAFDWYFRLPLWLQISCCGETLWAYNFQHLELIEKYVGAKLRERNSKGRNSFLSKLPRWMKLAKNRDEILKAIGKLQANSK